MLLMKNNENAKILQQNLYYTSVANVKDHTIAKRVTTSPYHVIEEDIINNVAKNTLYQCC